jgi:glycosyltransferase involved in cell wall biosynthesis
MRILLATDTYYPAVNGASYFTQRLAQGLARLGHEVAVMAPGRALRNEVVRVDGVTVYGIRSIAVPIYPDLRVSPFMLARRAVRHYVRAFRPDVIHIQNHFMIGKQVAGAAHKLHIPIMGTNHFMPENVTHYFHLPAFAEGWLKRFGWHQFARVYRRLDLVTTPTRTARSLICDMGIPKDIIPLSCGIDLERFRPNDAGARLKAKYGVPSDRPVLLYLGRLDKEKRLEMVIEALPEIGAAADAHLVLVGMGKLRAPLEAMARKMGVADRVTFTGFVPDEELAAIYGVGDVFVIAGTAELQSIATMEAMASGLPVLAVDATALPELVHDGENGYLFADGDVRTLARRAVEILSDPDLRARMGRRSLEIIEAHDEKRTLREYERLYREILGPGEVARGPA